MLPSLAFNMGAKGGTQVPVFVQELSRVKDLSSLCMSLSLSMDLKGNFAITVLAFSFLSRKCHRHPTDITVMTTEYELDQSFQLAK